MQSVLINKIQDMNFKHIFMIAALFLFSCSDNEKDIFNETSFKIGQSFNAGDKNTFEISKIIDSRCPIGTNCVREGEAKVYFSLTSGSTTKSDSTFVIGKIAKKDTVFGSLILSITSVDPHPEKDKIIKPTDYTVNMKVVKR